MAAAVMSSVCRVPLLVLVVAVAAVVGSSLVATQQVPLTCWSCSANTHGPDCYDVDNENKTLTKTCNPEEPFCVVNRIWYVLEADVDARNFSVNRTCALDCSPSCVVIGDRTKIHSCTSCCTTSYCNIGNSASTQPMSSSPLLMMSLLLVLARTGLTSQIPHHIPPG